MATNAENRATLREQYPDTDEYVSNLVKDWPPMSNEAIALCRDARRIYLAKLAETNQEAK